MKTKVLIVNSQDQYGYHIDSYKYAIYLKDEFQVTYLCRDFGRKIISTSDVHVRYLSRSGSKIVRFFRFQREVHKEINSKEYHFIFAIFYIGSFLTRLLHPKANINLDIRTRSVTDNIIINYIRDKLLKFEVLFFDHCTVLSHDVAKSLHLTRYHLLPLGGECFSYEEKHFEHLHLIYIGTLDNRNILECVIGFHLALQAHPEWRPIRFTIIGDGPGNELSNINAYIKQNSLGKWIKAFGYVHNDLLDNYLKKANIGLSYIPITSYFTNQPPTKTYEYLLSGLPVLATNTVVHQNLISECNGVLIQDNRNSIVEGLEQMFFHKEKYSSKIVKRTVDQHLWKNIVDNNLKPYIRGITKRSKNETLELTDQDINSSIECSHNVRSTK